MTNKQTMEELHKKLLEIWNEGRTEYIREIFDPNVNYSLNNIQNKGIESLASHINEVKQSIQNAKYTTQDVFYLENNDKIIQRWTGKGTFTAPFKNLQPTHKPFEYGGITICQVKNNTISDLWIYNNFQESLEKTS